MKVNIDDGLLIAAGIGVVGYLLGKYPRVTIKVLEELLPKVGEELAKIEKKPTTVKKKRRKDG